MKITISAGAGKGKTSAAILIARFLGRHGIPNNIVDLDGPPMELTKLTDEELAARVRDPVVIETVQSAREPLKTPT